MAAKRRGKRGPGNGKGGGRRKVYWQLGGDQMRDMKGLGPGPRYSSKEGAAKAARRRFGV